MPVGLWRVVSLKCFLNDIQDGVDLDLGEVHLLLLLVGIQAVAAVAAVSVIEERRMPLSASG